MIALIIECAVGDENVGWSSLFFSFALLRANHDQWQLPC